MHVARRFILTGAAFLVGAAAAAVIGEPAAVVAMAIIGLAVVLVGLRLRRTEPGSIRDGVRGTAEVLSVRETGTRIDRAKPVIEVGAMVTVAGLPNYEATVRMVVDPLQLDSLTPGSVIPVLVEAAQPARVVLDTDRVVRAGPSVDARGSATGSSADAVIRHGVPVGGILHFSGPTGLVARDLVPELRGHDADDPIHQALVSFTPLGGREVRASILVRVPPGVTMPARPGSAVPLRYLADDPSVATIDWDRR